ncbi:hypothetical protein OF83DRAFT_912802 [Amylostereum chailletii]|nr:hypothetical protein OF83DRAFT_912802 [Amylostereum chailletii]
MFLDMRKPFAGCKRQVIIAFDVGTTFSGISYAVLDPGKVPEIMSVTRYRGQEAGDAKVQTVLYYDAAGRVIAADAEDPYSDDGSDSEDEGKGFKPLKVEWFKLLFRPPTAPLDPSIPSPKLPPHKNLLGVAADYLVYLYAHVRAFIRETHASGDRLWDSVKDDAHFVLSHPNGWEGKQQSAMRRAAVMAGLVPDTLRGHERVTFVSEGEASLHYCVAIGLTMDAIDKGKNIMIIDAGGGTVDLSTYSFSEGSPISVEEIAPADSILQGSVIVRNRASAYLAKKHRYTRFGSSAYVQAITEEFDKTAKKRFKGYEDSHIKFSSTTCDRDDRVNIRNGRMKLSAEEVAGFFQPPLAAVIDAIEAQRKAAAPAEISTYLLVGGLGANEFFYARLHDYLSNQGLTLFRPDDHTRKAVAEGAVSFHIDHYVSSRGEDVVWNLLFYRLKPGVSRALETRTECIHGRGRMCEDQWSVLLYSTAGQWIEPFLSVENQC